MKPIELTPIYTELALVHRHVRPKLLEALRTNPRKARKKLTSPNGGRCCLRVFEETLVPEEQWEEKSEGLPHAHTSSLLVQGAKTLNEAWDLRIAEAAGVTVRFASLNDGHRDGQAYSLLGHRVPKTGMTHKALADLLTEMWATCDSLAGVKEAQR